MTMPAVAGKSRSALSSIVTLEEKRAFLEGGTAWPDEPPPDCIETHASLVFLTSDRAWKLKKPVHLAHIDLRTLKARAHFCREELRLNRELAGDIYCGLMPLLQRTDGSLTLGGRGRIVDWLIEIVRLPATAMLDRRLRLGPAPRLDDIEAVCNVLVPFYRARPQSPQAGATYYRRLLRQSRINAKHLREMQSELGTTLRADILDYGISGIQACQSEILERGKSGIVVEGHGDLRPEHVCLTHPPVVFDRVEFDHGFRLIDPFDEFNALGLECALLGAGWIRAVLLFRLAESGIPPPTSELLKVYGVNRYLTRARLAINHLRDAEIRTPRKWPAQARCYLATAEALFENPGIG